MKTLMGEDAADPRRTRVGMLETAAAHQREGLFADAEQLYRAILAEDGEDFDALIHLGVLKIAEGKPEEAERLIGRCAARGPRTPAEHAALGGAFLALQRKQHPSSQTICFVLYVCVCVCVC